jgi:hypothetical protein
VIEEQRQQLEKGLSAVDGNEQVSMSLNWLYSLMTPGKNKLAPLSFLVRIKTSGTGSQLTNTGINNTGLNIFTMLKHSSLFSRIINNKENLFIKY